MQTILIGSQLAAGSQALLFADVLARFYRQSGHEVLFLVSAGSSGQLDQARAGLASLDIEADWLAALDTAGVAESIQKLFLGLQEQGLIYREAKSGRDYFRLTDFTASLHELLDWAGSGFDQATRLAAADYLHQGLQDLAVTEKGGQEIMPWFGQVTGYLAASLAWAEAANSNWQRFWTLPAQTIYLGSPADRLELALFWPALLSALNPALKLPDQIITKAQEREIGKNQAHFPVDSKRYYLLRTSCKDLLTCHNRDLAGPLSSYIRRVYAFLSEHHFGCTPNEPCDEQIAALIRQTYARSGQRLALGEFDQALAEIFALLDQLAAYFTDQDPAYLLHHDPDRCDRVLASSLTGLVNLGQLLAPFLPGLAQMIRQDLGLPAQCSWEFVQCPGGRLLKKSKAPFPTIPD